MLVKARISSVFHDPRLRVGEVVLVLALKLKKGERGAFPRGSVQFSPYKPLGLRVERHKQRVLARNALEHVGLTPAEPLPSERVTDDDGRVLTEYPRAEQLPQPTESFSLILLLPELIALESP